MEAEEIALTALQFFFLRAPNDNDNYDDDGSDNGNGLKCGMALVDFQHRRKSINCTITQFMSNNKCEHVNMCDVFGAHLKGYMRLLICRIQNIRVELNGARMQTEEEDAKRARTEERG